MSLEPRDAAGLPAGDEPPLPSRYEVLAKIATGGMATVYVGRVQGAVGFSRLIAIKRPHPFVSDDPVLRESLQHEARVASLLHHPHVVSVLDVELRGDRVDLILDYVEGGTLTDLLTHAKKAGSPLPARVVVRVILDVASGLHAAHTLTDGQGAPLEIMHRDVSPQNILVGLDGQARLTDFGIAKIATENERTAADIIKGKLGYLAPEYVETRAFDARSDEYALGVVAWEALSGHRLFKGASDVLTLRAILDGKPPLLSSVRPELAALDGVVARAMARDPGARFASVSAFAEALEEEARAHGWVAPYGEVAASVEAAMGDRIRARRTTVESSAPRRLGEVSGERPRPSSPRDALPTLSIAGSAPEVAIEVDRPRASSRRAWVVPAVAAVALAGLGSLALALRGSTPGPPAPSVETAPSPLVPEPPPPASAIPPASTAPPSAPAPAPRPPPRATSRPPPPASPATPASAGRRRAPPNPYEP